MTMESIIISYIGKLFLLLIVYMAFLTWVITLRIDYWHKKEE